MNKAVDKTVAPTNQDIRRMSVEFGQEPPDERVDNSGETITFLTYGLPLTKKWPIRG